MTMETVKRLAQHVKDMGGRALLIGGSVRDKMLGIEPKDFDVEVFGIEADRLELILDLFAHHNQLSFDKVGQSFQVFKLGLDLDVSLPRRERKTGQGHKGFDTEADPHMTFREAARRRDFTINAMFEDPLTGEIIDPFEGQFDLIHRVLRVVDPKTFVEDSLRVLRAIQFAARFEFELADFNTFHLLANIDLTDLPAERLFGEFEKLLLKAKRPSKGLHFIVRMQNLAKLFPMIDALVDTDQDEQWHPEGSVFKHTLMVVDEAALEIRRLQLPRPEALTVMLAALAHDFGKPATTEYKDGRTRAHGHAEAGIEPTVQFLDVLGIHTLDGFDVRKTVLALVENHLFPPQLFEAKRKDSSVNVPRALRRMSQKVRLDLLAAVSKADVLGRLISPEQREDNERTIEWFLGKAQEANVEDKAPTPILMGRHLLAEGFVPGKQMGDVLKRVFEKQLDGEIGTLDEALGWARKLKAQLDLRGVME